jgi:drug/metabolite transporter (DMT)-like permease
MRFPNHFSKILAILAAVLTGLNGLLTHTITRGSESRYHNYTLASTFITPLIVLFFMKRAGTDVPIKALVQPRLAIIGGIIASVHWMTWFSLYYVGSNTTNMMYSSVTFFGIFLTCILLREEPIGVADVFGAGFIVAGYAVLLVPEAYFDDILGIGFAVVAALLLALGRVMQKKVSPNEDCMIICFHIAIMNVLIGAFMMNLTYGGFTWTNFFAVFAMLISSLLNVAVHFLISVAIKNGNTATSIILSHAYIAILAINDPYAYLNYKLLTAGLVAAGTLIIFVFGGKKYV